LKLEKTNVISATQAEKFQASLDKAKKKVKEMMKEHIEHTDGV